MGSGFWGLLTFAPSRRHEMAVPTHGHPHMVSWSLTEVSAWVPARGCLTCLYLAKEGFGINEGQLRFTARITPSEQSPGPFHQS